MTLVQFCANKSNTPVPRPPYYLRKNTWLLKQRVKCIKAYEFGFFLEGKFRVCEFFCVDCRNVGGDVATVDEPDPTVRGRLYDR